MFGPSVAPPLDFLQSVQSESGLWYQTLQKLGSGRNATTFLVMATGNNDANRGLLFALKMFHRVDRPEKYAEFIPRLVANMLLEDPADRPSAAELINEWRAVFEYVAKIMNVLEGRVFLSPPLT